jgi:hypothetical protein
LAPGPGAIGNGAPGPAADAAGSGDDRAERIATLLAAAAIARRAWERAGTWVHVERAEYQLALCHAAAGDGAAARVHARECRAICESNGADAVERFYAEEAMARAERAAGDAAAAAAAQGRMANWLADITDTDMRDGCAADLAELTTALKASSAAAPA